MIIFKIVHLARKKNTFWQLIYIRILKIILSVILIPLFFSFYSNFHTSQAFIVVSSVLWQIQWFLISVCNSFTLRDWCWKWVLIVLHYLWFWGLVFWVGGLLFASETRSLNLLLKEESFSMGFYEYFCWSPLYFVNFSFNSAVLNIAWKICVWLLFLGMEFSLWDRKKL